jgi:hypothetical protein
MKCSIKQIWLRVAAPRPGGHLNVHRAAAPRSDGVLLNEGLADTLEERDGQAETGGA